MIQKFTVKINLDKKLNHFVNVTFAHSFDLYGQNKGYLRDNNINIHGWEFNLQDIDLDLYPLITRNNLTPLVAKNEEDWVLLQD